MAKGTPKSEALNDWRAIPAGQNPLKHMEPIPNKAEGSRYGACGIRIDGTPEFINAVLSNLKGLIDGENSYTRLELARRPVDAVEVGGKRKTFDNAASKAEVCYIRTSDPVRMKEADARIAALANP